MRGLIGGMLTGGLVSVLGLGTASILGPQPAGVIPPAAPLVQAPMVDPVDDAAGDTGGDMAGDTAADTATADPSTPVGAVSIQEPLAPALPEDEAALQDPDQDTGAPSAQQPDAQDRDADAPRADTDPLDEPVVASIEGSMQAPEAADGTDVFAQPVDPILPNPQALAPQTPASEADLTVSTTPPSQTDLADPEGTVVVIDDTPVPNATSQEAQANATAGDADETVILQDTADTTEIATDTTPEGAPEDDSFVIDLGNSAVDAPTDQAEDVALTTQDIASAVVPSTGPRLQLGGENTLLTNRDTGVTIRRPSSDTDTAAQDSDLVATDAPSDALSQFRADAGDVGSKPLLSIVLIDDGSMSAASAALAGLPFGVTIAIDPATPGAPDLMQSYRDNGFEVVIMAKLPDGAVPSDVEITFESVFRTFPESIAVLDIGAGGLQTDRAVTEQAMGILAQQGRGFITASQGLNMAGRAADQAGVPAAVVFRELDGDNQDARVVRRFVDQAAFRARQESGVVLVGRVRPDTISALILWGTANSDDQIAVVPVSAVLLAE